MQLKIPHINLVDRLLEFGDWVTPSLGEIKDTVKFTTEMDSICEALEVLSKHTKSFASLEDSTPDKISESVIGYIAGLEKEEAIAFILGVFSLLFVVTGKSDNNCKCQFPIYLRGTLGHTYFPRVVKRSGISILQETNIPRILDDSAIAKHTFSLNGFPKEQQNLFTNYIEFILNEDVYLKSFWALGNSYFRLKTDGLHREFLMPLVVYRVRGSVSASGGHRPEEILRERLSEWGLTADIDFNTSDIVVGDDNENSNLKTRAFDFVLPFRTDGWEPRLFIQCQFYAGDSGSVSHKNVDQIRTSRDKTKKEFESSIFIEYVDGAGYCASLNGDLRRILDMRDTHSFFQVRTSVIKLRAALQEIGFLTPLEVIHAWSLCQSSISKIRAYLKTDGYASSEVDRVFAEGHKRGIFNFNDDIFDVAEAMKEMSRRYLLLDFFALLGRKLEPAQIKGTIQIPGFGPKFGLSLSEVVDDVIPNAGLFGSQWAKDGLVLKDIEFLSKKGWIRQQ